MEYHLQKYDLERSASEMDGRKKHIAMFISSLDKGGSERVLVNLAEYFYREGYSVTLVTQYKAENEYEVGGGIHRVLSDLQGDELKKSRIANFFGRFFKLRNIWKRERPDLILSFIGKNNVMAVLTSRLLHIPVIVSVRGEPKEEYNSSMLRLASGTVFRLADGVVLQTKGAMEFFPQAVRKKAVILRNSLNPAFLRETYAGEREKRIVAVGRIDANKNHEMLLRAFHEIAEEFPEYSLTIYGEGELRRPLQQMAEAMGLGGRVLLPGTVSDVAAAIGKASVFVLTSYSEGMPNTLLEAMALGLPVISADCAGGGPRELIKNGENGMLVEPGNWKQLAENLQKILNNKSYSKKMGENASKVKGLFKPDTINEMWKSYFEQIMRES